jgi:serine O-acetyltransferase
MTPPRVGDTPLSLGDHNANPAGIGLADLLVEDYRTHDGRLLEPGFLAIAVHRLGNARMDVKPRLLRAPLTLAYNVASTAICWVWGIDLSYTVRLGRRVRIWHHGGIVLGARAIGDDVHIRHNTTFGVLNRREVTRKPTIGNRVEIGAGACILGAVTVGDDSVIGPNSVVLRDVPAGSVVMGVPARQAALKVESASAPAAEGQMPTDPTRSA